MDLPDLPQPLTKFSSYVEATTSREEVIAALEPYKQYESTLRQIYAQQPNHEATSQNHLVPVFQDGACNLTVKARDLTNESQNTKDKYLLSLSPEERKATGVPATVKTLRDFKTNFNLFSESSLVDLNWDNVIAAGSSAVTALLPVPSPHNASKRALREYYHEQLAPASDVDLFLWGLNEEQAIEKIKHIEQSIRDSVLSETTVVRTKNAITIVSEYPIRQVQIVLRLYKSPSEILAGFDVDCSAVAYDGKQVWAAPRALAAFVTQMNSIDLTRRSPSYENRLSKYSRRGFEVCWPLLDRTRVDPTIFERVFNRVVGLARLLVLEKLPHPQDRDNYLTKRRAERGRPELPWSSRNRYQLPGNVKDADPQDIAEWVEEDDVSSYHTFTIPWGPKYTPKKIEKLLYSKDLLLNAEWNRSKDRDTKLHRHPAFFGTVSDVIQDCCGYCPKPITDEDLAAWETESKIFINGDVEFMKDDPGRQAIGSFHPLTDDDWTEMAYIGNTARLCQAIVDKDLEGVIDWFESGDADLNRRDHTGRAPIHLAAMCSTPEILQALVDRGARIVARLYNGFTALHIAAFRGNGEMVQALLDKSLENEAEKDEKEEARKDARRKASKDKKKKVDDDDDDTKMSQPEDALQDEDVSEDDESIDLMDTDDEDDNSVDDRTEGSFVKVEQKEKIPEDEEDEPDVYDIDVLAWDAPVSPLHLAIIAGHVHIIQLLVEEYAADVLLPVKLLTDYVPRQPRAAILSLLLPLRLPLQRARTVVETLLDMGASPLQADLHEHTALINFVSQMKTELVKVMSKKDKQGTLKAINHLKVHHSGVEYPLQIAIGTGCHEIVHELLRLGANPVVELEEFASAWNASQTSGHDKNLDELKELYEKNVEQPVIVAAKHESMLDLLTRFVERGADVNTLPARAYEFIRNPRNYYNREDKSLLDIVREHRNKLEKFVDSKPEEVKQKYAEKLEDDDHYLQGLEPGTYKYWSASCALKNARYIQAERAKKYTHDYAIIEKEEEPGIAQKKEAAAALAKKIKSIENYLEAKGAKSFYELYPDLKRKEENNNYNDFRTQEDDKLKNNMEDQYRTRFRFNVPDITPRRQERYCQLFEAAFHNDIAKVKNLCLQATDDGNQPLMIAVRDESGFSPFSVAAAKGHYELAQTVLDIAAAQYEKRDESKNIRYSLTPGNPEEYESDSDTGDDNDTRPKFYQNLVSDKFTVDDVDTLAKSVRSRTKPSQFICWPAEIWQTLDLPVNTAKFKCQPERTLSLDPYVYWQNANKPWIYFAATMQDDRYRNSHSLFRLATVTGNARLLQFLLDMEVKYSTEADEDILPSLNNRWQELDLAMKLGSSEIVGIIIKARGSMMPLYHLAKKTGITVEVKPKYYQGLSVYGTKRRDWAQRGQNAFSVDKSERGSPILDAVLNGNLDTIEWFMSDALTRKYIEFTKIFDKDQRIHILNQDKGGINTVLKHWMSNRVNLILHMAIMSWPGDQNDRLRNLLEKVPAEYLEIKSAQGYTPLQLAAHLHNWPAFKLLLSAGANQRTRNRLGDNILHDIYRYMAKKPLFALFQSLVSLLDPAVVQDLLLERTSAGDPGSLTPLALYLRTTHCSSKQELRVLDAMLDLSAGKDLTVLDGAGDYPIHVETRSNNLNSAKLMALRRPDLLSCENATGMTCLDIAETQFLQNECITETNLNSTTHNNSLLDKSARDFLAKTDKEMTSATDPFDGLDDDETLPYSQPPTYRVLTLIARKYPHPRRLVSLLDANEIAKRLAKNERRGFHSSTRHLGHFNRRRQYDADNGDEDEDPESSEWTQDEVHNQMYIAERRMERVTWDKHLDEHSTREEIEAALRKFEDFAEGKGFVCCEKAESDNRWVKEGHAKLGNMIDPPEDE